MEVVNKNILAKISQEEKEKLKNLTFSRYTLTLPSGDFCGNSGKYIYLEDVQDKVTEELDRFDFSEEEEFLPFFPSSQSVNHTLFGGWKMLSVGGGDSAAENQEIVFLARHDCSGEGGEDKIVYLFFIIYTGRLSCFLLVKNRCFLARFSSACERITDLVELKIEKNFYHPFLHKHHTSSEIIFLFFGTQEYLAFDFSQKIFFSAELRKEPFLNQQSTCTNSRGEIILFDPYNCKDRIFCSDSSEEIPPGFEKNAKKVYLKEIVDRDITPGCYHDLFFYPEKDSFYFVVKQNSRYYLRCLDIFSTLLEESEVFPDPDGSGENALEENLDKEAPLVFNFISLPAGKVYLKISQIIFYQPSISKFYLLQSS